MSHPIGLPQTKSVLWNFKFAGTTLAGSLSSVLVSTFAPPQAQIAVLGSMVSILAGLLVAYVEQEDLRERRRSVLLGTLKVPLDLAREPGLFGQYAAFGASLRELARRPREPVLREFALLKLASLNEEVRALSEGQIVFSGTETWRTIYEALLQSPDLGTYRSVAWVKARTYWQDPPGRQSMRLNVSLAERGLRIERIVILRGDLWPEGAKLPCPAIRPWIHQQHESGIALSLIREEDISGEKDLACDFGLYGDQAVGIQELDDEARTVRFVLQFDGPGIQLAEERWSRLCLYASSYGDLVDRNSPGG